jgi:hypothetical protein
MRDEDNEMTMEGEGMKVKCGWMAAVCGAAALSWYAGLSVPHPSSLIPHP